MNPEMILWPMVVIALVTLFMYIPMSKSRIASVRSGKAKASDFKLLKNESEESLKFANAIRNQYETPVLFYAVCLASYITANVSHVMLVLAWIYALAKIAHVCFHVTSNRLRHRRPMFMIAWVTLIVMWIAFALHLAKVI